MVEVRADVSTADTSAADLWSEVVGQDRAVTQLRAAAAAPVHAYLLVGPEGSGTREAARAFAADLLSVGMGADAAADVRRRVGTEGHPCLTVVERVGAGIDKDQLRSVVEQAHRTPVEGDRQTIVLIDVHLTSEYARLLKTLEEPPGSTVFVLTAEELPTEMATIASRCVRVDLTPVAEPVIAARLVAEGIDPDRAQVAASGAGGSLSQARLLTHDPSAMDRRELWLGIPGRLDGTGATAAALADEVLAATELLAEPLTGRQEVEIAELDAVASATGNRMAGDHKAMLERHKREQKRVRTADLRAGLAALLTRYRETLVDGGSPEDYLAAADAVQELCDTLAFNPNTTLQLQSLFVGLPRL